MKYPKLAIETSLRIGAVYHLRLRQTEGSLRSLFSLLDLAADVPDHSLGTGNLTDSFDGFLRGMRYVILDRDPLYERALRSTLGEAGVNVVRLPARRPNFYAFAERFVLSSKSGCLNCVVPLGERHLRHTLEQYVRHCQWERNHQELGNELIEPFPENTNAGEGVVRRRARLGGHLSYYYREAA